MKIPQKYVLSHQRCKYYAKHIPQLIHHATGNFNIQPDKAALSRIYESLSALHQARDLQVREAESALRKLSRTLQATSSQHAEELSSHNSGSHAQQIVHLDTQKFRIAKAAADLEVEGERLEQELDSLKQRLRDLDEQGVEGDESTRGIRAMDDATMCAYL